MQKVIAKGFTLLEIMLAVLIMGLVVSTVTFTAFSSNKADELEKQVKRFQVVFDLASDFAILNQRELGVYLDIDKQNYRFMYLDEEQVWQFLEDDEVFQEHQLPEDFSFELELDGLAWQQEDSLFSADLLESELSFSDDEVQIGDEEEAPPPPPQIFIFSSGEITPFSLSFIYEPNFGSDQPAYYRINGIEATPLEREGPLESL